MSMIEEINQFEDSNVTYESAKLTFHGVEGFDVYNTSIPFKYKDELYIYGRVEHRMEWARSWVRLFKRTGKDVWALVENSMVYQLEDPYIALIDNELVLGGTHVRYTQSVIDTFFGYFYKGNDLENLYYFTTGPEEMKDIRLVQLMDKRIGVFSRPRSEEIRKKYGSGSVIGFTIINDLSELNAEVIEKAPAIEDMFGTDEWGGCNQCYLLSSGLIGVIAHKSCNKPTNDGGNLKVYVNTSFVFNPETHTFIDEKIIATRHSYPEGPAKRPSLVDCAFASGIVMRPDGKVDLYSGIGDTEEGRVTIDYPFAGHGEIIEGKIV